MSVIFTRCENHGVNGTETTAQRHNTVQRQRFVQWASGFKRETCRAVMFVSNNSVFITLQSLKKFNKIKTTLHNVLFCRS